MLSAFDLLVFVIAVLLTIVLVASLKRNARQQAQNILYTDVVEPWENETVDVTLHGSSDRPDTQPKTEMDRVDTLEGRAFEKYLQDLFERQGYQVQLTPYRSDWGADLVLCKDNVKTAVQAKRHQHRSIGVQAVQEVVAAKAVYGCTQALVVSNSLFTENALTLARANGVVLWDRSILQTQLPDTDAAPLPLDYAPSVTPVPLYCSSCGKSVSDRVAKHCWDNSKRYQGRIYCYEHQKSLPSTTT